MLKLSIIIPVYNEERHIEATLESIAKQTKNPYEVIVVDNNSTDSTTELVGKFKFVKLINEKKQGRAYARSTGFNMARGDVLGRIDGDSQLEPDWAEKVLEHFKDDSIEGLTGLGYTPLLPILKRPLTTFWTRSYYWNVHGYFGVITTWGATMAIRKSSWSSIKNKVIVDDSIVHEDQDIALWMAGKGQRIVQANDVRATSFDQSFRYLPKLLTYISLRNKTKRLHKKVGNLPAKNKVMLTRVDRTMLHLLSIPSLITGLLAGLLFLPLDIFMVKIAKKETWFD